MNIKTDNTERLRQRERVKRDCRVEGVFYEVNDYLLIFLVRKHTRVAIKSQILSKKIQTIFNMAKD